MAVLFWYSDFLSVHYCKKVHLDMPLFAIYHKHTARYNWSLCTKQFGIRTGKQMNGKTTMSGTIGLYRIKWYYLGITVLPKNYRIT